MPVPAEIADLFDNIVPPIRAAVVALVGVWLAWSWLQGHARAAIVTVVMLVLGAYLVDRIGQILLPEHPVAAVFFIEWWIVVPLTVGAVASAAIVLLAVALAAPKDALPSQTEPVKVLLASLSGFLTAAFIAWTGQATPSPLARRIKRLFSEKYQRPVAGKGRQAGVYYFSAESAGERWVASDEVGGIQGWGHGARLGRARGIAEELRNHSSDAP